MKFGGIQKTSIIDFPDRVSTVMFTPGCNLRCPYCHNWRLVINPSGPFLSEAKAIEILEERREFVDAVVITGGEPTLHRDLPLFLHTLKELGYSVKLDSNGILPEVLRECILHLDYVAVDVKTSPDLYSKLGAESVEGLQNTIEMLKHTNIDYEFRCTVVPGFVNEETVPSVGEMVEGASLFVFQQFVPGDALDPGFNLVKPYSKERISRMGDIMKSYVEEVDFRI